MSNVIFLGCECVHAAVPLSLSGESDMSGKPQGSFFKLDTDVHLNSTMKSLDYGWHLNKNMWFTIFSAFICKTIILKIYG